MTSTFKAKYGLILKYEISLYTEKKIKKKTSS